MRLVASGMIPKGPAIDLGTGPGHDAVFLARNGFEVTALDIASNALALARANARKAGVAGKIRFRVQNVLELSRPRRPAVLMNDRGCFHVLAPQERAGYIRRVLAALSPRGFLFLRTFSTKEPPGPGPHRFTLAMLRRLFAARFEFVAAEEGIFEGPRKPRAWQCLLRKK